MSLSRCSSWPRLSLHCAEINNIMHAVKTLYNDGYFYVKQLETNQLSGPLRPFPYVYLPTHMRRHSAANIRHIAVDRQTVGRYNRENMCVQCTMCTFTDL